MRKNAVFMTDFSTMADPLGTHARISVFYLFRNQNHQPTCLPPIVSICLHWNFYGGLRKFCLFLQEWRFSRSRSSKVIDVGTNWKCVCVLILVRNSNLGPMLHRFRDFAAFMCSWPHPYSTPILEVFSLQKIAHVGVSERMSLKLFEGEIIFEVFQPMWSRCLNVTDTQTDGRMDGRTTMQSH